MTNLARHIGWSAADLHDHAAEAEDARSAYIEAEAESRAKGPYDADEVDYHLDALRGSQTEKLFAQYLNTRDAIALLNLIETTFAARRQDYHESEVARELREGW